MASTQPVEVFSPARRRGALGNHTVAHQQHPPKTPAHVSRFKLWHVVLALLGIANLAYFLPAPFGWAITLTFFLFIPGYLVFKKIDHAIKSRWEHLSFSLGISLLLLMLVGLALNSLYYVGLRPPLTTLNIFLTLDVVTLFLLYVNRREQFAFAGASMAVKPWHVVFALALPVLPLLAIGGAIRLNNGESNIVTMVLFGLIAVVFLVLTWRRDLRYFYPYALFIIALSVLLTVSLRGWGITGHDIQREYAVFEATMRSGFWDIQAFRDPYNACLSITILPTILAKLTGIADPYIYKVVFQAIFAFCIVPIYFLILKVSNYRFALLGAFLFIAFPTFINDMSMLNRQEIGFTFFSLLILIAFTDIKRSHKKTLTIALLLGLIISHYSSSYVMLGVIVIAWLAYAIISKLYRYKSTGRFNIIFPTLNITIIIAALLSVFLWNAQITETTGGLKRTIGSSISGLVNGSAVKSLDLGYSLFGGKAEDPQKLLDKYVLEVTNNTGTDTKLKYVGEEKLPLTPLGESLNQYVDVGAVNSSFRSWVARVLQVLLIIGCITLFIQFKRQPSQKNIYLLALSVASITALTLQTVLPQVSVDYGILRLFQQLLIILALPTVVGLYTVLFFMKRFRMAATSLLVSLFFLHLSGFVPQLTGGYSPQLALNNKGLYYDAYYVHPSDDLSRKWLLQNGNPSTAVSMDKYLELRFRFPADGQRIPKIKPAFANQGNYIYLSHANATKNLYAQSLAGKPAEYIYYVPPGRNIIYNNAESRIYR